MSPWMAYMRRKELFYAIVGDRQRQWITQERIEMLEDLEALRATR